LRARSLARGTAFAAALALGGVVLWLAVAWATGREFGFLAWAVGALAGLGMMRESDDHTPRAGVRAAALAAAAIVLARLVLFPLVVVPGYAGTFASAQ